MVPSVFFGEKSVWNYLPDNRIPELGFFLILKQEYLLVSNYCPSTWERLKVIVFGD